MPVPETAPAEPLTTEEPPAPPEPTQAPPAWRTMRPRRGRKAREAAAAAAAGPPPPQQPPTAPHLAPGSMMPVPQGIDPTRSWATWMRTCSIFEFSVTAVGVTDLTALKQHPLIISLRLHLLKSCKLKQRLRRLLNVLLVCSALDHARRQCTVRHRHAATTESSTLPPTKPRRKLYTDEETARNSRDDLIMLYTLMTLDDVVIDSIRTAVMIMTFLYCSLLASCSSICCSAAITLE